MWSKVGLANPVQKIASLPVHVNPHAKRVPPIAVHSFRKLPAETTAYAFRLNKEKRTLGSVYPAKKKLYAQEVQKKLKS